MSPISFPRYAKQSAAALNIVVVWPLRSAEERGVRMRGGEGGEGRGCEE